MSGSMISFEAVPAIGTIVMLDEQAFTLLRSEPYVRQRDGVEIVLLVWVSACAECGAEYEWKSPLTTSGLTRRCREHSKPSTRVKPNAGRGHKVTIRIIEPAQDTGR